MNQPQNLIHTLFETARSLALLVVVLMGLYYVEQGYSQLDDEWSAEKLQEAEELIPTLDEIEMAWQENRTDLEENRIPATLSVTLKGLALAIVIGLMLAAIMDLVPPIRWLLYPILVFTQTIPIFAIAVLLIVLFGFEEGPKIVVVTLFCFFPITVNTLSGLQNVNYEHIALLRSIGANPLQIWWKVRLPAAMPSFFSGLRLAATYSVVGAIIGEYVGSGDGLGKFLRQSQAYLQEDKIFLAIFIISGISVALVLFITLLERVATRWRYVGQYTGNSLRKRILSWLSRFNHRINPKTSTTSTHTKGKIHATKTV